MLQCVLAKESQKLDDPKHRIMTENKEEYILWFYWQCCLHKHNRCILIANVFIIIIEQIF
jgi:hypothetical protein